jgi:fructose-1,6-bisphosphatase/inositol monophosphatase family enzyme
VAALIVDAAERAILPRYGQLTASDVREKATDEIVTIADRDSELILSAGLAKLLPDATIVGEEGVDADPATLDRLDAPWCWIIDPLDGTANFAAGSGPFGILVALARFGEPVGGWIYDPRTKRLCVASKGRGLTIDGRRTVVATRLSRPPSAAVSSMFERDPALRACITERIGREFSIAPIPRCAAEQYPRMIFGDNDITLFQRTLPWDHAAGVLCVTEAGGIVSRLDGAAYRVDDKRDGLIVAGSEATWSRALELLAGAGMET